ncbi:Protein CBG28121 [Caenorhabditis briggsae]|uniref:Protein CBG28121 n=1 Tax=Caenorhabditis briggsae TaxID=6238 RepID=B6IGW0_CAEBR|nr:Protein CBG28121 [Caenorhabditis briggsae]CAR99140.1 Protein CBG28121 [Caenorhabditis briggsae]
MKKFVRWILRKFVLSNSTTTTELQSSSAKQIVNELDDEYDEDEVDEKEPGVLHSHIGDEVWQHFGSF